MDKKGKTIELLPITKRVDGSMINLPVIKITGEGKGPTLLLVGGVHGDEAEGIQAILDIVNQLDGANLRGTVIGVPVANVAAFVARKRGNPSDDWNYDMNRLFPGSSTGSLTQRFAHKVMSEAVSQADMVVAMHSGGNNLYCCKHGLIPSDSEDNIRLFKALGPGWEILTVMPGFSDLPGIAAKQGKAAVTIEYGGVGDRLPDRFNEKVQGFVSAINNLMKAYGMIDGKPLYSKEIILAEDVVLRNEHGGLIRFGEACRPGNEVRKGEELFTITDFLGNAVEVVKSPYDGFLTAIPGLVVVPTGGFMLINMGKNPKRMSN